MPAFAFLLLAPKVVPLGPLFGKPRVAVERALGKGKPLSTGSIGGVPRRTIGYGGLTVEFVNGRMQAATRAFPDRPVLDWAAALGLSGFPAKGTKAESLGGEKWRLTGGGLPKGFEAVFAGGRKSLRVRAPYSVVTDPSPAERKAILDALRPGVEKAFHGQKVRFVVHMVAAANGWAFLTTSPVAAAGGRLDLKNSDFAEAAASGATDDSAYALLQRVGGVWRPVETALLPTDVAWEDWSDKRGAPRIIFPDFTP